MPSHTISVKVSEELKSRIEAAQQDGETRSACLRRLIRTGLDNQTADSLTNRISTAIALVILGGYPSLAAYSGAPTLAVGFIGFLVLLALFEPQINQIWTRLQNHLDRLRPDFS